MGASQVPQVTLTSADGTPVTITGGAITTTAVGAANGPAQGALTDRSGSITAGGTAQQLIAVNSARKYLFIRNPITATERLWFNFTTTAVADSPSIALDPGDTFVMEGTFVSTEAISVLAATTGHKITAKEG